jgi:alpha,alpha-trehalase
MYRTPDDIFQELFTDLHKSGIWHDGKIISDAIPKASPSDILQTYRSQKGMSDFDLEVFFNQYFEVQKAGSSTFQSDPSRPVEDHIRILWDYLTREADVAIEGSSLIPLPYPYVVPGGRFNEIYYWDSYFTMLGLKAHGRHTLVRNMVDNFSWLIDKIGHIPNGNRTYFLGRSQPPFYSLMVQLLAEIEGEKVWLEYIPALLKEYNYWMRREEGIHGAKNLHTVTMPDGTILNRYYDRVHMERMEMYADDRELADRAGRKEPKLFLDLRAACESGWDFSARWMDNEHGLGTIRASDIVPVDLNCLIWNLEDSLSRAYHQAGDIASSERFSQKAASRKEAIHKYLWDEGEGYFFDYDTAKQSRKIVPSLAGLFPLFFNLASQEQANACRELVEKTFLRDGGLVSTAIYSGQQWDAPNGWAPLQWTSIVALRNYGFTDFADEIARRWVKLCTDVYNRTGKMMEKYNVEDASLLSGGGEYPVQDGFGWTNGVLVALKDLKFDN